MQISSNIIGFPVPLTRSAPPAVMTNPPAEIVEFPVPSAADAPTSPAHDHGKIFAAHRIVTRIADQLEQTATL